MAKPVSLGCMATGSEGLTCFVCGNEIVGRYYALATCRTQTSKVRLIEKLGELVGEDYMVVISEGDIICRGCATMINSVDRLEREVRSIRSMVLRYLEKKYDIHEGELVNTRSNPTLVKPKEGRPDLLSTDFQTRKRKAMTGEIDVDELKDTKESTWVQCDRCKFTTNCSNASKFHPKEVKPLSPQVIQTAVSAVKTSQQMVEHVLSDDKHNGEEKMVIGIEPGGTDEAENLGESIDQVIQQIKKDDGMEHAETVEMITAEIGQGITEDGAEGEQLLHIPIAHDGKQVTLQAVEGEDGESTLCMIDENGMIIQKVEQSEDGTFYMQMAEGGDSTKQVLSVAEDGTVQVVEVLWNDMNTDDGTGDPGMVTF